MNTFDDEVEHRVSLPCRAAYCESSKLCQMSNFLSTPLALVLSLSSSSSYFFTTSLLLFLFINSMGWYHLTQLLEMPNVNVTAVVEPYFLGICAPADVPQSFKDLMADLSSSKGIKFVKSVSDLDAFTNASTMCLIAGRTSMNPSLFADCVAKGASCIYLEKPGAPTVGELEAMKELAESQETPVKVFIGYNKNVTSYVQRAMAAASKVEGSTVEYVHNNSYTRDTLPECFERNSEGM